MELHIGSSSKSVCDCAFVLQCEKYKVVNVYYIFHSHTSLFFLLMQCILEKKLSLGCNFLHFNDKDRGSVVWAY